MPRLWQMPRRRLSSDVDPILRIQTLTNKKSILESRCQKFGRVHAAMHISGGNGLASITPSSRNRFYVGPSIVIVVQPSFLRSSSIFRTIGLWMLLPAFEIEYRKGKGPSAQGRACKFLISPHAQHPAYLPLQGPQRQWSSQRYVYSLLSKASRGLSGLWLSGAHVACQVVEQVIGCNECPRASCLHGSSSCVWKLESCDVIVISVLLSVSTFINSRYPILE